MVDRSPDKVSQRCWAWIRKIGTPLPLLLVVTGFVALNSQPSTAQNRGTGGNCPPASQIFPPLQPGADIFVLEGTLTAYDRVERTLSANGITCYVPPEVDVDTDEDGIGDLPLDMLLDPALEAWRTVLGYSIKAEGILEPVGSGCSRLTFSNLYVERAEHVIVGVLSSVDAAFDTFAVAGVQVIMNDDPRFPSLLLGAGGDSLPIAALAGFEGTLIEAVGAMDGSYLMANRVETDAFELNQDSDTVVITRAFWRADKQSLQVRGTLAPHGQTGELATFCEIHLGVLSAGNACASPLEAVVQVTPEGDFGFGEFTWDSGENMFSIAPDFVCAQSPLGSAHQHAVAIKD